MVVGLYIAGSLNAKESDILYPLIFFTTDLPPYINRDEEFQAKDIQRLSSMKQILMRYNLRFRRSLTMPISKYDIL